MTRIPAPIGSIEVSTYKVPTEPPDTSGLTTLFLVAVEAAGVRGIGYTYAEAATARLVRERFAPRLRDQDAFATTARSRDLQTAVRALGATEMVAAAASAVE